MMSSIALAIITHGLPCHVLHKIDCPGGFTDASSCIVGKICWVSGRETGWNVDCSSILLKVDY